MRQVKEFDTAHGKRYRVRYRKGGVETSETFRNRADARAFATILDGGGVVDALQWIEARKRRDDTLTFNQWLEQYVDQLTGVTPRTRADYHNQARRYLSTIADMPLPLITRAHIAGIVNDMETRGLSSKTIKNAVHAASSVFALAVEEGHMSANPCRRVRLPQPGLDVIEARFLTEAEFAALYEATEAHYRPLVAFLAGTGLRWSEATALRGRDVSIPNGTVRVDRAWKRVPGAGWEVGPPKSRKSRRTVNAAVLALAAVAPLLGKPDELVFRTPSGKVVRHNNFFNRVWQPAVRAAGLVDNEGRPTVRIHDLRHTHASWLISDGQSLEAVQDQLGHESILTTRKVYGRLLPAVGVAVGRSASAALERALSNGVKGALTGGLVESSAIESTVEPADDPDQ